MKKILFLLIAILSLYGNIYSEIKVKLLNTNLLNSKSNEYAPILNNNEDLLIFVSEKVNGNGDFYGVYIDEDGIQSTPRLIENFDFFEGAQLNSKASEGTMTMQQDGKKMYFGACDRLNGYGDCDIFMTKNIDGDWKKPFAIGDNHFNTTMWDNHPAITQDGKTMYFASNREKSIKGSSDIWVSKWDNGIDEWSKPKPLKAINTEYDENSPYIAADGLTLFFASNAYDDCLGEKDFYYIKKNPNTGKWGDIHHLLAPINSAADEMFISFSQDGGRVFFSSDRKGQFDIYMANIIPLFSKPLTLKIQAFEASSGDAVFARFKGKKRKKQLFSKKGEVISVPVPTLIFGSKIYADIEISSKNPNYQNSIKTVRVFNNQKQNETTINFLMCEEDASIPKKIKLSEPYLDAKIKICPISSDAEINDISAYQIKSMKIKPLLNYIFFDENSSKIPRRYKQTKFIGDNEFDINLLSNMTTIDIYYQVLNIIGSRMTEYPTSKIKLIGYNSNYSKEKRNTKLSKARANEVADYLISVWSISKSRIVVEAKNLPKKASSSKSPEGRSENQRVEIITVNTELLEPIVLNSTTFKTEPEVAEFIVGKHIENCAGNWKLNIISKNKILQSYSGQKTGDEKIFWNIGDDLAKLIPSQKNKKNLQMKTKAKKGKEKKEEKEASGFFARAMASAKKAANKVGDYIDKEMIELGREEEPTEEKVKKVPKDITKKIRCELLVQDSNTGKTIVDSKTILFTQLAENSPKIKKIRVDKFSLISFDFAKYNLTKEHKRIINVINNVVQPNSIVNIYAYSDVIGKASSNLRMSAKRAKSADKAIKSNNKNVEPKGESVLLFDNDRPEGRMYSRTVIIEVETETK